MMTLSQAKNGFTIGLVGIQKRYFWEGWNSRREMLFTLSRQGLTGIRFGAMPGFFEWEQTVQGRSEYDAIFPVKNILTKPSINPAWREYFNELLDDMGDANLLPIVYLIGGCDLEHPLNPYDARHAAAISMYAREVYNRLKAWGGDYLVVTGNELYCVIGHDLQAGLRQVSMAEMLISMGMPMDRIRVSTLDGYDSRHIMAIEAIFRTQTYGAALQQALVNKDWQTILQAFSAYPEGTPEKQICHINPGLEWLQVAAFDPAHSNQDAVEARKGKLGFELHEISSPRDFDSWGKAGRIEVNNKACFSERILCNMYVSTDGARPTGSTYAGVGVDEIGPIYARFLTANEHQNAGNCPLFEHLPNEARIWKTVKGIPVAEMHVGESTIQRLKKMAAVYQKHFGHKPTNAANPVYDEPDVPAPVPVPEPVPEPTPKPTEENNMKYINLFGPRKKTCPWVNIRFAQWFAQIGDIARAWRDTAYMLGMISAVVLALVLIF